MIECAVSFGIDFFDIVRKEVIWNTSFLMNTLAEKGNLEMIQYFDRKLPTGFDEYRSSDHVWGEMASNKLHIKKWICEEKIQHADNITDMKSRIEAHEHVLEGVTAPEVTYALSRKQWSMVTLKCLNTAIEGMSVLELILCYIFIPCKTKIRNRHS